MNAEEHESRETSGVSRRGRIVVVSVLSGVLLTGLLAWWAVAAGQSRYHRDPTLAGSSREYDRKMDSQLAVRPDMDGVLDSIETITNEPDILIEMPVRRDLDDHIDNTLFEFHRIDPGEAFESPAGRIWLDHVAVAHGEFPADQANAYSVRLPARFFDAALRELSEERIAEIAPYEWDRLLDFRGRYPAVKFVLKSELTEDIHVLGYDAFDARTHQSLAGGYSWGGGSGKYHVEIDLELWHSAPIALVADIAFGPPQIIEFPARVGERVGYPGGELRLVVMAKGMDQRSTTRTSDKLILRVQPRIYNRDETTTCFVFACLPRAHQAPLDIEILDAEGEALQSQGGGTSGLFVEKTVLGDVSDAETVRVKFYPDRKRLIFHLPEIPGLPPENQEVGNLFDVRIPYVQIRAAYDFRDLVSSLTQMEVKGNSPPNRNSFGPMSFENVTVKDLVQEYARLYGPGYEAQIDPEQLTLEFVDQSLNARLGRVWARVMAVFR